MGVKSLSLIIRVRQDTTPWQRTRSLDPQNKQRIFTGNGELIYNFIDLTPKVGLPSFHFLEQKNTGRPILIGINGYR